MKISSELSEIFNNSFSSGIYPSTTEVILVHKKDSKLDFSNYRPISLLSNVEKILERLMYNRMYNFFSNNNLIYLLQYGFRQKYSTVHALISLTENFRKNLDKGNIGCGIFVNLQKAFDTAEHDILLSKLEHYVICGIANGWFKFYLSNRKQYVSNNSHDSNFAEVKFGVPQGSWSAVVSSLDLNPALKFR